MDFNEQYVNLKIVTLYQENKL